MHRPEFDKALFNQAIEYLLANKKDIFINDFINLMKMIVNAEIKISNAKFNKFLTEYLLE